MDKVWNDYESECYNAGYQAVCGVDEAGRGPLAGPVYAAAVILPRDVTIEGLDDSKKLSPKKREALFYIIKERAAAYAVASANESEIDDVNILNATFLAMRRAIDALPVSADFALIDGNLVRGISAEHRTITGGDRLCRSIAAASVLAKVSRDMYMKELSLLYPAYSFHIHKGYPTKAHINILREIGPCPAHRASFLKKILRTGD